MFVQENNSWCGRYHITRRNMNYKHSKVKNNSYEDIDYSQNMKK